MKHKFLLFLSFIILILAYSISCQKGLNKNFNSSNNNTDTTPNIHCDTTIIGTDTCIKCNDSCVRCADICETDTTKPFVLFMNLSGSDNNSGLTEDKPLATLHGVQEKLIIYKPIHQDVEVRIKFIKYKPYTNQGIEWTYTSPIHNISFMPSDYKYGQGINDISGRPAFDGQGANSYFFKVLTIKQTKTNLRFYYIEIRDYIFGGINFHADKDNFDNWNGYNTIYGCYFDSLGDKYYPQTFKGIGYGAIDLVNSDHNIIQQNHFAHCENGTDGASHMHGVYLSDNSDHNLIQHNNFTWISGDAVRIRNFSNNNIINDSNEIRRCGVYSYYSTYRDLTKGECRSWENEFRDNICECGYAGQEIQLFTFWVVHFDDNNKPKQDKDDSSKYADGWHHCQKHSRWLYTSGNQRLCR